MEDVEKEHPSPNGDLEVANGISEKAPPYAEHKDQVTAGYGDHDFIPPTPKEEAAVIWKLDRRLIPIVFVMYMLAVLDRSNLGNAKLAGLEDGESQMYFPA